MSLFSNTTAQQKDFQLWSNAGMSKEFNKKFTLGGEFNTRFNQNVSSIDNYFVDLSAKYKVSDWYKPGITYRLRWANDARFRQRLDIDNTFRVKLNDERFYFRVKAQREFENSARGDDALRLRLKYSHEFGKKVKGYAAGEYFYSWRYTDGVRAWTRQRYTGGLEFEFKKKNFIDVYYRYQFDTNLPAPDQDYIIGIGYKLELD